MRWPIALLLVSATAHANLEVDGKQLHPLQQSFAIDDVKITLDIDRQVVRTGDTVTATLIAYSETPKKVKVEVSTLHTRNYEGEPNDTPWERIARGTVVLTSGPNGGTPVTTRLALGTRPKLPALTDSFRVFAAAPGTKPPEDELGTDQLTKSGGAAVVAVRGWSGDDLDMVIAADGAVTLDAPFTVEVRTKNTTGRVLSARPWIELATEDALTPAHLGKASVGIEIHAVDEPGVDGPWPRGGEYVRRFMITPHTKKPQRMVFLATAMVGTGTLGLKTEAGAIDIKTFDVALKSK